MRCFLRAWRVWVLQHARIVAELCLKKVRTLVKDQGRKAPARSFRMFQRGTDSHGVAGEHHYCRLQRQLRPPQSLIAASSGAPTCTC